MVNNGKCELSTVSEHKESARNTPGTGAAAFTCAGLCGTLPVKKQKGRPYMSTIEEDIKTGQLKHIYLLCGAAVGALSPELFRKSFLTICGWGGIIYFISEFMRFFFFFYLFGKAGFAAVFTVILPGLLYSLIVSPLAAAPALFMRNRFKRDMPLIR